METARSSIPDELNPPQTAQTAIGQYDVRATPLQMAQVAAAVANGGTLMRPYVVSEVLAPDLTPLEKAHREVQSKPFGSGVAADLTRMMVEVVRAGTGTRAQIPGVTVAGKTGTAQNAGSPHAWFIGFAPAEDPRIVVAVLVENGGGDDRGTGGRVAAPVAQAVMAEALRGNG
jgi:peptidoglycan glycosyltransferase